MMDDSLVQVVGTEEGVLIRPYSVQCVFCGCREQDKLREIKGKYVCDECVAEIRHK